MLSSSCLSLRIPSWHAPNDQLVNGPTHSLVGPNKRQCTKIKNNKICFCPVYLSKARSRWQWKSRLLVKQQDLCCKKYFIQFYQCKGNSHLTIINEIYTALHILKRIFLQYIYKWKTPLSKASQLWVYLPFLFSVACVASVSSRLIARKLEREQKKKKMEGGGGGGGEKRKRLPANTTILENAPWYITVRFICKLNPPILE